MEPRHNYSRGPEAWDRDGVHFAQVARPGMDAAARALKRGSEFAIMTAWGDDLEWVPVPVFDGSTRLRSYRAWLGERVDEEHALVLMRSDDGSRTLLIREPD